MSNPYQEALGATLIERTFRERIVLVGVTMGGQTDDETEEGLDELSLLIDTAGPISVARRSSEMRTRASPPSICTITCSTDFGTNPHAKAASAALE